MTGTLLAGVLVGQLHVEVPSEVKQCFFLLFLFAVGFRTGPQFFRGLRSEGLSYAGLAALVATTALFAAYGLSRLFGFDPGTGAGLLAGALTDSASLGTALDTVNKLPAGELERTTLANNIPVAFAVTYLVGTTTTAWVLAYIGPKLMERSRRGVPKAGGEAGDERSETTASATGVRAAGLRGGSFISLDWQADR